MAPTDTGSVAGFGLFRGIYEAKIYAALFDVVAERLRASVAGWMIMFAFLTGASSPYLLGMAKPVLGLSAGLAWLGAACVIGAAAIAVAWRFFFQRDAEHEEQTQE